MKKFLVLLVLLPNFAFALQVKSVDENGVIICEEGKKLAIASVILKKGATDYIKDNWSGREVILQYGKNKLDRNGNDLVQIKDDKDNWLQGELIERSLVHVYPSMDNDVFAQQMLSMDRADVLSPFDLEGNIGKYKGKFAVVEATVLQVKRVRNNIFINFGEDWRTDFTVLIKKSNENNFTGIDVMSIAGKKIRVRGWVEEYNGPLIKAYGRYNLEII